MVLDIQDIFNSVAVPSLIKDDYIKQGSFYKLKNGDFQAYVGGFSIVFPVEVYGRKWAFRCWHRTLDDSIERIKLLSVEIKNAKLPYLIDYDYVHLGIIVGGRIYPTIRMQWVDGITIKDYIIDNYRSHNKLVELAEHFLGMAKDMHKHSFAHGDLQHGNILIDENHHIFLVDYDSFYCPQLKGEKDIITGLRDYQHPAREKNSYVDEKLDYFSELIIYLSILGIALRPELAKKYKVEDSEHLLFEAKDYRDITHSEIYHDLYPLRSDMPVLLKILELYLSKNSISELEPFDVLFERMTKAPEIKSFECEQQVGIFANEGLYIGDKINLVWDVEGATKIKLNGTIVQNKSIQKTLGRTGENVYTLNASNDFKDAEKVIKVFVHPAPIITFASDKVLVHSDKSDTVQLSWDVKDAYAVNLVSEDNCQEVSKKGKLKVKPTCSTKYTIRTIGLDRSRTFEKTIEISAYPSSSVSFEVDSPVVLSGHKSTLSWNVENATSVELEGFGKVAASASRVIRPKNDTEYVLRITDPFGTYFSKKLIKTLPLPIVSFSSDKNLVNLDKNQKVGLDWKVENAQKVELQVEGEPFVVNPSGGKNFKLKASCTPRLIVLALDGQTVFEHTLSIKASNEAVIEFSANRRYTLPEIPVVLTWNVRNASYVEIQGLGKVSLQGSQSVTINEKTTFKVIATDDFGKREKTCEVNMLPLPIIGQVNVPVPEMNSVVNVAVKVPSPSLAVSFPTFNLPTFNVKYETLFSIDIPHNLSFMERYKVSLLRIYSIIKSMIKIKKYGHSKK